MTIGKLSIWVGLVGGLRFWFKRKKFGIFKASESKGMIRWGVLFMGITIIMWAK